MRVLLRDSGTGKLATATGGWTSDLSKALDFRKTTRAIRYAFELRGHVTGVELLYHFGDPRFDIAVALGNDAAPHSYPNQPAAE